ncbi:DUF1801 domain-containing protein [Chryseolinea lacunae]|uniref:DUF1801 domain-containing protein n=1 Tax=Chryseolinea lacunae TaxID=2801331 RepID=A0ABS1KQS2_9BACT|nr:DUF1801 domain-containing protein [Chryseolinea lacunae]MBL0741820.1 hypothetical protein [Chryseolinea lacunae]
MQPVRFTTLSATKPPKPSVNKSVDTAVHSRYNLNIVFNTITPLLIAYEPRLKLNTNYCTRYDLFSEKENTLFGRRRKDIPFLSLVLQKNYVGLYFMPVYFDPELKKSLSNTLRVMLKGKSCFHLTHIDDALVRQLKSLLRAGYKLYQKNDWL